MDETTVKRALVYDKVQQALLGVPELDDTWRVLLVSAGDRRDQLDARAEIQGKIWLILGETGFDRDSPAGQILTAVLEYFDGEEGAGL